MSIPSIGRRFLFTDSSSLAHRYDEIKGQHLACLAFKLVTDKEEKKRPDHLVLRGSLEDPSISFGVGISLIGFSFCLHLTS